MNDATILIPETQATATPNVSWKPTLDSSGKVQRFEVYEAEIFRFALQHAGGCVSHAAEMLGVGRATMYRKMRAYGIVAPPVAERAIDRTRKSPQTEQAPAQAPVPAAEAA